MSPTAQLTDGTALSKEILAEPGERAAQFLAYSGRKLYPPRCSLATIHAAGVSVGLVLRVRCRRTARLRFRRDRADAFLWCWRGAARTR